MNVFDFLNSKSIINRAFKDKRTPSNKTIYGRFMKFKRGQETKIEKHELEAYFEQYDKDDKNFRSFVKTVLSKMD